MATIFLGDCRDIMPTLPPADAVITDPVWPNCPDSLIPGSEDPVTLLNESLRLMPLPKRLVLVMRSDSDPRILSAVPSELPFFRAQMLPYVMPGYIGRKLGGDEIAYGFGEPISFAPGQRVIPFRGPNAQPGDRRANGHPCSRALLHFEWLIRWWSEEFETVLDP